jgi:hypothetical protein
MNILFISIVIAIFSTALSIRLLRPLALKIDLVDHPTEDRKNHQGSVPLIGGLDKDPFIKDRCHKLMRTLFMPRIAVNQIVKSL